MSEERHISIDSETLSGRRFPYQEDISLVEDVDLLAGGIVRAVAAAVESRGGRRAHPLDR